MPPTQSNLIYRSKVEFDGHPTSLRLEPEFWEMLKEIAYERRVSQARRISVINQHKGKDIRLPQRLGYSWRSTIATPRISKPAPPRPRPRSAREPERDACLSA
jgi:hypothetical protein